MRSVGLAILVFPLVCALPRAALGYTQWSAAVSLGGGGRVTPQERSEGLISLGLRADALFSPRSPLAVGVGPFLALRTDDFEDFTVALGASLKVPTTSTLPFVFSFGGVVDLTAADPLEGTGILGRVWWGSRSMNYHSSYGMAVGLWVDARYFPATGTTDVVAGIDGDLAFAAIPFILLYEWIRH